MAEILFWSMVAAIAYTYVGYSLAIMLIARFVNNPVHRAAIEPRVTYLITAYNEERNIGAKLE